MVGEPRKNVQDQLLKVADSIVKVAETVPSPVERRWDAMEVPYNFLCPLSKSIMIDPVLLSNGETYERAEIEEWWRESEGAICPMRGDALLSRDVTPNHLIRVIIREWCKKYNKSYLIYYNHLTPLYITQEYFESLHLKLSFAAEQKEAAKHVRKDATNCAYFRRLYAKLPKAIPRLIATLSRSDGNPKIDPQLEEDLIATLMVISVDDKVKKQIAESTDGISVLIQALQSDNIETQRNAAFTIFQISWIDSNIEIVGKTDAMLKLATLLMGSRRKLLRDDVNKTLFRLFRNNENKVKAVKQFAYAGIFRKIEDSECVDPMLPIFASLSKLQKGINEIENYNCNPLLRLLRDSHSGQDQEFGSAVLLAALKNDGSKWKKMIIEEENANGTISGISRTGNSDAKKTAKAILDLLKD